MKQSRLASLAVLVGALTVVSLTGCGAGDNSPVKEDPKVAAERVGSAQQMRSYFDKSGGNYDALSAEDKAALDKLSGSPENSKTAFSHMGPSGGASGGVPPSGGGLPPSGG